MPAGVMRQRRSWCLDPDYPFGVMPAAVRGHCAALELPPLSLSFTDDEHLSEQNIQSPRGSRPALRSVAVAARRWLAGPTGRVAPLRERDDGRG
jgi:predicted alpha/beta hydrolase